MTGSSLFTKLDDWQVQEQHESEAMAEALKEEGNKLMVENKPIEAIAKYVRSWGYHLCAANALLNLFLRLAFPVLYANSAFLGTPRLSMSLVLLIFCCPTGALPMQKRANGKRH